MARAWSCTPKGKIRRITIADGSDEIIPFRIIDEREMRRAVRFPVEVAPEKFPVKMLRWVQVSPAGDQVVFQSLGYLYVRNLPDGRTATLDHSNRTLRVLSQLLARRQAHRLYNLER